MTFQTLAIISVVALLGPLLATPRRWNIPVVVGQLAAGVIVGRTVHSPERLLEVATELNNRPRKTLGGITPTQAMQRLLSEPEKPIVATTG